MIFSSFFIDAWFVVNKEPFLRIVTVTARDVGHLVKLSTTVILFDIIVHI
jgi:hypothetical protein